VGEPGTETVSATFAPVPLYSVERLVPLSEAHHGVVGPALRPQPFTSDASVVAVLVPPSDTSGLTTYASDAARVAPAQIAAASTAIASAIHLRVVLGIT
jgi:hypothetical protein